MRNRPPVNVSRWTVSTGSVGAALLIALALLPMPPAVATSPGVDGEIAYVRQPAGSRSDLFAMNANGSGEGRLTSTANIAEDSPAWSPTGGTLAFQGIRNGHRRIFVLNASTGVTRRVSSGPFADRFPTWSADGRKIAYRSLKTQPRDGSLGSAHIYVVPRTGGTPVQLTSGDGINTDPAWSPDGTKIAFASNRDGNYDLYLMDPDGSDVEQITKDGVGPPAVNNRWPTWSPDGTKIAFTSNRAGQSEEIWVLDMSVAPPTPDRLTEDPAIDRSPAWSPSGERIAFASNRGGNFDIWTVSATNESDLDQMTSSAARETEPTWQPLVDCTIEGTDGAEVLVGTSGRDVICALGGNDTIRSGGGSDRIYAGPGLDQVRGGAGSDVIRGGRGNDTLFLGTGRDSSYGGFGRDTLYARDRQRDLVDGGPARDRARVDRRLDVRRRVEAFF